MASGEVRGKKIAVVGSGITGLSSAWLLHRSGARVTLYERESKCGGHTLTDDTPGYPVDLGFQVFNLTTYPNFVGLLECLGVDSEPSDMSFALSLDDGALEWGSHGLGSIFAQRRNLLSPSFLGMVRDVVRFGREAPEVLKAENLGRYSQVNMGAYLAEKRYSRAFVTAYLLPMCAAVWSVPNSQVMQFSVVMLVRFWVNHHLLDLIQRPVWRVVKGRSRSYVDAILSELPDVRTSCAVTRVTPRDSASSGGPWVTCSTGVTQFDAVVMATHSDTALALLGDSCPQEAARVLRAIPYNGNEVYLHTDEALMPRNRATWASWNFLGRSGGAEDGPVCVTYWINNLQRLPAGAPDTFVTLNPAQPPAENRTLRKLALAHPVYSFDSYRAQEQLPSVQGKGGVYFAGAWAGYGFHEDGLKAGMEAATLLGASIPWDARPTCPKISLWQKLGIAVFDRFARSVFRTGYLRFILPNGEELCYGDPASVAPPVAPGQEWRERPALSATVRMFDCDFFWKLIWRHDTGVGESFMDSDFEVDNLGGLMAVLVANAGNIEAGRGTFGPVNWAGSMLLYLAHMARSNTHAGSRSNIEQHYDAGNDMYCLFLDDTMTYSSGMYNPGDGLHQGQLNKLDALIEKAGLRAEHNVVEVGCGWGSLAIRAVQTTGCCWTGITLSKQQLEEATARVKAAGLTHKITLLFCDYRDLPGDGTYDRLLSCEMVEAVGHEHLPSYFASVSRLLKPGGIAVLQAISMPDARYEAYCKSSDFIREHIFPGGHLPSLGAMVEAATGTGLSVQGADDIGKDYAITLRQWRAAWERRRTEALQLGYPDTFWRKFRFYFAYCEAAFDAGYIHNYQITWVKRADAGVAPSYGAAAMQLQAREAAAMIQPVPAKTDHVLQALLWFYFLMATTLASSNPKLWLTHATCATYNCLFSVVYGASSALWPAFRVWSGEAQAWWCANLLHLLHSMTIFACAMAYLLSEPRVLDITWPASATAAWRADHLIFATAGFYGFQLVTIGRYGLFKRTRVAVLHLTLLLALFSAAAIKAEHTPLLACTLVSELPSALYTTGKLLDMAGAQRNGLLRSALRRAELVCLPIFQLIPHCLIAISVILQPSAFSAPLYWGLAMIGCLYLNVCNVRAAAVAYGPMQKRPHQA